MHLHELAVEDILTVTEHLLSLSLTRLLSLALSSLVLSKAHHGVNVALLLQAHKLLRQRIHRFRDDGGLHSLSHAVHDSLLIVVDQHVLFLGLRVTLPLLSRPQFSNEVQALFFTLEHHVLLGAAAKKSLEQDNCPGFLVTLLPLFVVLSQLTLDVGDLLVLRRVSSQDETILLVLLVGRGLSPLLFRSELNIRLSSVKGLEMVTVFAAKLFSELLPDLVDTHRHHECLRLLHREDIMELLEALV